MTALSSLSTGMLCVLLFISHTVALSLPGFFNPGSPSSSGSGSSGAPCKDYLLISARGTGELQGPSVGFLSAIRQTLNAVPNGQEVDVQYPAAFTEWFHPGTEWTNQFLTQRQGQCPHEKHALLGYSQGAMVVASAAAAHQPDDEIGSRIAAIVVIGNPYHVPGQVGNVDEPALGLTTHAFGDIPNPNPTYLEYAKQGRVLDLCFAGDSVCDLSSAFAPAMHLTYGGNEAVQNVIAKFLISKLQDGGGGNGDGSK
ncbi:hypothetical protein OC845_000077 [Tilletia horrida]|nr:hypothetical protein OC845_000077 [Tilletia horrida]